MQPDRGNEKFLSLGGRQFKIRKFEPEPAMYWACQLMGNMTHLTGKDLENLITDFISRFVKMDRETSRQFQRDCLSHVEIQFESGWHPLIQLDGNYAVQHNPTLTTLLFHSFGFTIADFFDGALMGSLLDSLGALLPTDGNGISSSSPSEKATGSKKNSGTVPTR